jgi:uncharacterized membrane protein YfcA
MSALTLVPLFLAAALGGALNSVAGGGSFIAFPSLLFAGVPAVMANATNTVALWPAGLASVFAYRKDVPGPARRLAVLSVTSLVGGIAGAELLLRTSDTTFVHILPWLLLVATLLFTMGKRLTAKLGVGSASPGTLVVVAIVQTVIAVYGGYFGGGMGILMLATMSLAGMTDIHAMNALKTILSSVINGVAVVLFVLAGAVAWRPGSVMVVGGITGGYFGAVLAKRVSPARVRTFVGVVAWTMTIYFFVRPYVGSFAPAKP